MRVNASVLGFLSLVSVTAAAQAEVIYYVNNGTFRWGSGSHGGNCTQSYPPTWLDITRSPSQQTGSVQQFNSIAVSICNPCSGCSDCENYFYCGTGVEVMIEPQPVAWAKRCSQGREEFITVLRAKPDSWIGPSNSWRNFAILSSRAGRFTPSPAPGRAVYALRVTINGQRHYGWTDGRFAWAYESTPNTPIKVPCIGDFNYDRVFDNNDVSEFQFYFENSFSGADVNNDGLIDFFDYLDFFAAWSTGCGDT